MAATIEICKSVCGHGAGLYEVSDRGHVRRIGRGMLKATKLKCGYMKVGLCQRGIYRQCYVHQLVLESFVGPCPSGFETRHLDDNKVNNQLENLCWGTYVDNAEDAARNNKVSRGSQHYNAKLNEEIVTAAIQEHFSKRTSIRKLAIKYGVAHQTMSNAVSGKKWRHVHG